MEKDTYHPCLVLGELIETTLDIPRFFHLPSNVFCTVGSKANVVIVAIPQEGDVACKMNQLISYFKQGGICKRVLILVGLSEPFVLVEHYKDIVSFLKTEILRNQKITVIPDKTSYNISEVVKIFEENQIECIPVPGFRNLHWGVPESENILKQVTESIQEGLQDFQDRKVFVRCRRWELVRQNVIERILKDSQLHSNSIFTLNMGDGGKSYAGSSEIQIAFNRTGSAYCQEHNEGWFTHEYNFFEARKDFLLEVVVDNAWIVSEKTYKPMLLALPCFYLGYKGLVEELHREGLWTFDQWWDESYDNYELEDPTKLDLVFAQIKQILAMSDQDKQKMFVEMIPVFLHNAKILSQRSSELESVIAKYILSKNLV